MTIKEKIFQEIAELTKKAIIYNKVIPEIFKAISIVEYEYMKDVEK